MGRGILLQGLDDDWIEQARGGAPRPGWAGAGCPRRGRRGARRFRSGRALHQGAGGAGSPRGGTEPRAHSATCRGWGQGFRAGGLCAAQRRLSHSTSFHPVVADPAARRSCARDGRGLWPGDLGAPSPYPLPCGYRSHPVLLGRAAEIEQLHAAMAQARSGERQTVLVGGEPGIGKTALMARFADSATADTTVLFGRCSKGAVVALAPFVEALRHYASSASTDRLLRELPAVASQLVGLIPELADSAFEPATGSSEMQLGETGRLVRMLVETVLGICAEHPLAHHRRPPGGRPGTLRAVGHLVAASESTKLLVLVSYRDTEADQVIPTLRQLRHLPSTRSIILTELGQQDIGELASATTDAELSPDFVPALHRHSGGNPCSPKSSFDAPRQG